MAYESVFETAATATLVFICVCLITSILSGCAACKKKQKKKGRTSGSERPRSPTRSERMGFHRQPASLSPNVRTARSSRSVTSPATPEFPLTGELRGKRNGAVFCEKEDEGEMYFMEDIITNEGNRGKSVANKGNEQDLSPQMTQRSEANSKMMADNRDDETPLMLDQTIPTTPHSLSLNSTRLETLSPSECSSQKDSIIGRQNSDIIEVKSHSALSHGRTTTNINGQH